MARIYAEIRVECKTAEEKTELLTKLDDKAKKLGLDRANYIRLLANARDIKIEV